ncbi:hypothetical protein Q9X98_004235 [Vibrio parahaemolyticus]|uniref:hypothetical protein n=1 Tax=Vibrio alginolyticus TaxID=663 RepID=UPI00063D9E86|nr:hypothetical protein [Vibrio alginolyticus]ELA7322602.1 hypothetical protein [Vibrio parahaemolyticus]KLI71165.1 hypothetical protein AAW26_16750 [Vibrio alginolyticus]MCF9665120.1 hypothetical protein [Vibrio parahaemolyticus]MDM4739656.1 hypothetical protein [Vibrio alginolyticus]MDM4760005.1 hypothetical protein [Vibrio alginolyticus]
MKTSLFIERDFKDPKPEHEALKMVNHESLDLDNPKFDWEYFGRQKYNRYAVCANTNVKRSLTMGEFYGSSVVD